MEISKIIIFSKECAQAFAENEPGNMAYDEQKVKCVAAGPGYVERRSFCRLFQVKSSVSVFRWSIGGDFESIFPPDTG